MLQMCIKKEFLIFHLGRHTFTNIAVPKNNITNRSEVWVKYLILCILFIFCRKNWIGRVFLKYKYLFCICKKSLYNPFFYPMLSMICRVTLSNELQNYFSQRMDLEKHCDFSILSRSVQARRSESVWPEAVF